MQGKSEDPVVIIPKEGQIMAHDSTTEELHGRKKCQIDENDISDTLSDSSSVNRLPQTRDQLGSIYREFLCSLRSLPNQTALSGQDSILRMKNQFIHVKATRNEWVHSVAIPFVYAKSAQAKRRILWSDLVDIAVGFSCPWAIGRDFNAIKSVSEYLGRAAQNGVASVSAGNEQVAKIAAIEANGIHIVGVPTATDCADMLEQQKQVVEAKESLAVQTAPMQLELVTKWHVDQMCRMPMELRDDHQVNFCTKKKRVVLENEVVDSLSDLDEVLRVPYPQHQLFGNLKSFLNSFNATTQEPLDVISASQGLSGIQKAWGQKKTYSVTRTILTR
ncbi:hypothetical protein ACH5RR_001033 [Cinchona calisaya]|uniref:Uncharacterized protein n=1 Tax=Cinchona calisaya TaxID=153742 RepID=A0ABD3B294_9GENT